MSAPELQRLDHISFNVSDRPRSITWYGDVLGLEQQGEAQEDDSPVFMRNGGVLVALFQAQVTSAQRAPESTGLRHIAFALGASDFTLSQDRLHEHGVDFRPEDHGNALSIYFNDPDGNVIELTTYER